MSGAATSLKVDLLVNHDRELIHVSTKNCCSGMYCVAFDACRCQSMRLGVRVLGAWRIGLLGALGALAGALVLVATRRYSINISPDSTYYVAATRGVVRGDGVVGLNGAPLSLFPPALPLVLAGAAAVGDPVTVARWFNAVLFGTSVFGVGLFLAARIRLWLAVGVAATLAVSSLSAMPSGGWISPWEDRAPSCDGDGAIS